MVAASPAFAGEYAVLSTGFRIHAERHEVDGSTVRLFTKNGMIEVPSTSVSNFEDEEYVAPVAVVAPPSTPAATPKSTDPKTLVREAAVRNSLPPAFVASVAKAESAMKQSALSPKGAIGVMQLMPSTAKALDADPHDTEQNIDAGTRLLKELLIKYDGDVVKALAAYNAGPGAVAKYNGLPPYRETQDYVNKVIRDYQKNSQ
jgi:soluble lytic murein transglycosylase-like protein